jgi:hypothetical protein
MVQKYYTCSFEKEGERYCGLAIRWDYVGKKVQLSMPSYIDNNNNNNNFTSLP